MTAQQPVIEGFELSPQQRATWRSMQVHGGEAFVTTCRIRIEGPVEPRDVREALGEAVRTFEILRTTFARQPSMTLPIQLVSDSDVFEWREVAIGEPGAPSLADVLAEMAGRQLDVEIGPVLQAWLAKSPTESCWLLLRLPALCADAATAVNLVERLSATLGQDGTDRDSGAVLQYADVASWLNDTEESERETGSFGGGPGRQTDGLRPAKMPFDRSPSSRSPFRIDEVDVAVPSNFGFRGSHAGASYDNDASSLMTAWHVLLCRLVDPSKPLLVAMEHDGRHYEELDGSIGPFALQLPIGDMLDGRRSWADVEAVTRERLHSLDHRESYFPPLQLDQADDIDDPLDTPYVFQFLSLPAASVEGGVGLTVEALSSCAYRFKLRLVCVRFDDRLAAAIQFDAHSFSPTDMEDSARRLSALLASARSRPEAAIDDLDIMVPGERGRLVDTVNETAAPDRFGGRPFHRCFQDQVVRTPEAPALFHDGETLSYRELNRRADDIAKRLRGGGVVTETRVGICFERSIEMVAALLGVLKAGGAFVPLDPSQPPERTFYMLRDAGARFLLTQPHLSEPLAATDLVHFLVDGERVVSLSAAIGKAQNRSDTTRDDNLAYVIYTSGSTGRPKGVAVEHRSLTNLLIGLEHLVYSQRSGPIRATLNAPLFFDASLQQFLLLLRGDALYIVPESTRTDGSAFVEYLAHHHIDALDCTPSQLEMLIGGGLLDSPNDAPSTVLVAGEPIDAETWARLAATDRSRFYNIYGPTECTVDATGHLIGPHESRPTIGRPLSNYRAYVVDRHAHPTPAHVAGDLYIGGRGLARGYLGQPGRTADAFRPAPFGSEEGARIYHTGDRARWLPDATLEFLGRYDHQVKILGARIELAEIELVLAEHPLVSEAVVLAHKGADGRPDRLEAYVVPSGSPVASGDELREYLRRRLPAYMVPVAVGSVDRLPLTRNGKLDRNALAAMGATDARPLDEWLAPRGPVEEALAGVWVELLQHEAVSRTDDFFDLGGHSLLAARLVARILEVLDVAVPVRAVFDEPTIAELAAAVERVSREDRGVTLPPLEPQDLEDEVELSFAQRRLWFLHELDPETAAYNIAGAVRIAGALDVEALDATFVAVMSRHEALRTRFITSDGQPVQVIGPPPASMLAVVDLRGFAPQDRLAEAQRRCVEIGRQPFDLRRGGLLRTTLLQLDDAEFWLVVAMHHIASDGWSLGVLVRDVELLYQGFTSDRPLPIDDLPIRYVDYANWERTWLRGDVLDNLLGYWRTQLEGIPSVLELPTDRARPAVRSHRGATERVTIREGLVDGLRSLAREENATLFMAVLAAFQVLLYRHTNQTDIVVGTPVANRTRAGIEGVVGFFSNTLAMRTQLSPSDSFRDVLRRVRETALGAYAHQDLPFERLVEELQPERDPTHDPIFQIMVVYQNAPNMRIELNDVSATPFDIDIGISKFDLTLVLSETPDGLEGALEYSTDLFDASTIKRLVGRFLVLLEGVVGDSSGGVGGLGLLSGVEGEEVVGRYNATGVVYGRGLCVHELFGEVVVGGGDGVAVVGDGRELTFGELDRRANGVAWRLRELGVGPDVRVGVAMGRSPELVVGLLGVLKAGGAYVPLGVGEPVERLQWLVADAGVGVVLVDGDDGSVADAGGGLGSVLAGGGLVVGCDGEEVGEAPVSGVGPQNLAYVVYTSGSTGRPKGVMVSHRGVVNYLSWCRGRYEMSVGGGVPVHSSLSFDLTVTSLWGGLVSGQRVVLVPERVGVVGLTELLAGGGGFGVVKLTPSHLELLTEGLGSEGLAGKARVVVVGGEALRAEQVELWRRHAPLTRLVNEYGPTEAVVGCCVYEVDGDTSWEGPVLIGRPTANMQVYVLDAQLCPVPFGVVGELFIGGDGLARGYLNQPGRTGERFVPHPFSEVPGARLYRSGDLGRYREGGQIEFVGRNDDQVKIRGIRVEPGELEQVLGRHGGVRRAAVVARRESGREPQLVAYVVGDRGLDLDEVRVWLGEQLPDHLLPAALVRLDELPVTANGKLDRSGLPAPGDGVRTYVPAHNPIQEAVAQIFAEVLGIERVGIHDNFFTLGGDSIRFIRVVALAKEIGLDLSVQDVFDRQTVAEIAEQLETTLSAAVVFSDGDAQDEAELIELLTEVENLEEGQTPADIVASQRRSRQERSGG